MVSLINFFNEQTLMRVLRSVAERTMHWQDRVRQALQQQDVTMALLELQQRTEGMKDPALLSQERKMKRAKNKTKDSLDSSAQLTPNSSDAGSDTGNVSDSEVESKLT